MKSIFQRGQKAPEFLIWANYKWGAGFHSTDTADQIEETILKILNVNRIVNNLHRDLWDDIKENREHERGRTFIRVLSVRKIILWLKNDPLFLELFITEFNKIDSELRQLKAIHNYNSYIKCGKWITGQYSENDPDLLEKWALLDNFINTKENDHKTKMDNAFKSLENITLIQDDKKIVVRAISTNCDCGGRFTNNNYFKHIRTDRHIRHKGGKISEIGKEKNIICQCGENVNKYQYPRHIHTLTHMNKINTVKHNQVLQLV
jgi:hypothetical protein